MPEDPKQTDAIEQPEVKEAPVEETQAPEDASRESYEAVHTEAQEAESAESAADPQAQPVELQPSSARVKKPGPSQAGITFAVLLIIAGIAVGIYGLMFA